MKKIVSFNRSEFWTNYDPDDIVKAKISVIEEYIPKGINTILDVGCGNGIITNTLNKRYNVTGVDLSPIALTYIDGEKIQSSSDSIPVDDESFDMVFSSEMLEHLDSNVLSRTIEEFKRISRNYIFITIPNQEHLKTSYVKCSECGNVFHPYGHLNSFDLNELKKRFKNDFELVKSGVYGPKKRYYNSLLLSIKHRISNRWFDVDSFVVCPQCNNENFPKVKGNIISKACNFINRLIGKRRDYWLFAMFERKY